MLQFLPVVFSWCLLANVIANWQLVVNNITGGGIDQHGKHTNPLEGLSRLRRMLVISTAGTLRHFQAGEAHDEETDTHV